MPPDAGVLATCGDACTAAQTTASCMDICAKIARAGCSFGPGNDCPTNCASIATPACAGPADAYLRCIEPLEPTCVEGGVPPFSACDSQLQAVTSCLEPPVTDGGGTDGGGTDGGGADGGGADGGGPG